MKKFLLLFAIAAMLGACEKDDVEAPAEFQADPSANAGNLLIVNSSNKNLVLYNELNEPVRKIPNSETDYLVNISNDGGEAIDLKLYDWEDVKEDINNPNPNGVFKRWRVPVANSTARSDQVTWHVSSDSQYSTMATIYFNYYAGSTENVDIFLNGRTGAKLMSLAPGQQRRKIGLDYGNHTLAYHYWQSDQGTADGMESKGWIEKQTINGDETNIWLVLNENRSEMTMVVPHFGTQLSDVTKYGNLRVENFTGNPLQIYSGQMLIESIVYLSEGSTTNLSTIAGGESYEFVIPITGEEVESTNLSLRAVGITTGNAVKEEIVTITADETLTWTIGGEDNDQEEETNGGEEEEGTSEED